MSRAKVSTVQGDGCVRVRLHHKDPPRVMTINQLRKLADRIEDVLDAHEQEEVARAEYMRDMR